MHGFEIDLVLPDLWQQGAVRSLKNGLDAVIEAPTGAGKTYIFELLVESGWLDAGQQAVYTVPTRALANDKWREWRQRGWKVGIATGDLAENVDAPVLVATLETQRERFLRGDGPKLLVVDEYQMIGDPRRGLNYELAIALAPRGTQLLLLSGSVDNPQDVVAWLERIGRRAELISHPERPVPLDELPVAAFPHDAPKRIKNFWQRLALGALLSDAGPLLIFAPQRRAAERIAKKVAEVLPQDDPISLDGPLRQAAGSELDRLLQKRVAYHHSGLSFAQRAGIVEPLAKAGQLRVVVATMGLAAGINFSVRSVHVADTQYSDGPFEKQVAPDELLQMFGRAGRRGKDEIGYIITSGKSPNLLDAHARHLRRTGEIDWPTLLRVMRQAADEGESPFEAATRLSGRLFSLHSVRLGFEATPAKRKEEAPAASPRSSSAPTPGSPASLFGLGAVRHEVLNSAEEWESSRHLPALETVPLGEALARRKDRWVPGPASPEQVSRHLPAASRLCRFPSTRDKSPNYGAEMAVASQEGDAGFRLTKRLRRQWKKNLSLPETASREEVEHCVSERLPQDLGPFPVLTGFALRGTTLMALLDLSAAEVSAYRDRHGAYLIDPPRRSEEIREETVYEAAGEGTFAEPLSGSAAHAWRKLGLISANGTPTRRGQIFSFFQAGEGLVIAAALEETHYPIDELVTHLANVRGGYRFDAAEIDRHSLGSEQLGAVCRNTYGAVDYEGYLQLGLPRAYGEGAAEAVHLYLESPQLLASVVSDDFGRGDVERAYVEWFSLLRHILHAPDLDFDRWRELKVEAAAVLKKYSHRAPSLYLPEFPPSVLNHRIQHRISYRQLEGKV